MKPDLFHQYRLERIEVFYQTLQMADQGAYTASDGTRVAIEGTEEMCRNSKMYTEEFSVADHPSLDAPVPVEVVNDDCLAVAERLVNEGYNPAVLNLANRYNPGGGVLNGSRAQEETLCRRSNLYLSLVQFSPYAGICGVGQREEQYPLALDFGGIYSPGVTVFRLDDTHGYAGMTHPYRAGFITVAGINRPDLTPDGEEIVPRLVPAVKNKLRTILRIGLDNGHDALVLGALGCGAFRNPPAHVARLFHEVFLEPEFANKFRRVVFAILDDHNANLRHNRRGNFLPFYEEFQK